MLGGSLSEGGAGLISYHLNYIMQSLIEAAIDIYVSTMKCLPTLQTSVRPDQMNLLLHQLTVFGQKEKGGVNIIGTTNSPC